MKRGYNEKGSVILYAMLTMASMLAIGLTLNLLFLNKFKTAYDRRNSVVAIYAADTATELCLYEARTNTSDGPFIMDNGAVIKIEGLAGQGDITGDCAGLGSSSFGFRATGTFKGVRRTLEISQ